MFPSIFTAIGGIKTVLCGLLAAAAIAGALWVVHLIKENGTLESQLDQALAVNKANLAAFAEYKQNQAETLAALAAQHSADLARSAKAFKLKQEIARAPRTDDGAVAPVLAHTLERLRVAAAANPDPD